MSLGVRDEAGQRRDAFQAADRHRVAARRHVLRQRRLRQHARGQVRQERKFLMTWGTRGTGQRRVQHAALDHDRQEPARLRRPIAQTTASRCSTKTASTSISSRSITQPYHIRISDDQFLWAFSGPLDKLMKYDLNGHLLYAWGTHGTTPGLFWAVHEFSVDSDGNFYTAEVFGGRSQKFSPRRARTRRISSSPSRSSRRRLRRCPAGTGRKRSPRRRRRPQGRSRAPIYREAGSCRTPCRRRHPDRDAVRPAAVSVDRTPTICSRRRRRT